MGCAPATLPHSTENAGTGNRVDQEMFEAPVYQDVSSDAWVAALPPELVEQHLGLGEAALTAIPKDNVGIAPPDRG